MAPLVLQRGGILTALSTILFFIYAYDMKFLDNISQCDPVLPPTTPPDFSPPKPMATKTPIPPLQEKNQYLDQLIAMNLTRSVAQHQKFLARKDNVTKVFPKNLLFHTPFDRYAGLPLSDEFAYLHIWKCGGSTIQDMLPYEERSQQTLDSPVLQQRKWITFVRDPIDHFLSGWAECASKPYLEKPQHPFTTLLWRGDERDYDFRVRAWLYEIQTRGPVPHCSSHSHPQVNFMIHAGTGKIDPHFHVVGDLSHLREIVVHIGKFRQWKEGIKGRDALENAVKQKHYPNRKDLLSEATLLLLCEYLQLDYYLLDFEPPEICIQEGGPLYDIY
jgi:hypothetical protein